MTVLETYREQLVHFNEALQRERFLHASGQKEALELYPVYDRYADLFTLDAIGELRQMLDATSEHFETKRQGLKHLVSFAEEGFINRSVTSLTEQIAAKERQATVRYDSQEATFHRAPERLAHEPDPVLRRAINRHRIEVIDRTNEERAERLRQMYACSAKLGYQSYAQRTSAQRGIDLGALAADGLRFLETTDELYGTWLERTLPGIAKVWITGADRADVDYFLQRLEYAELFPEDGVIPAYRETLRELGIDFDKLRRITIDDARRPGKHARSLCAPLRIPEEIKISLGLTGGPPDYQAMLHEGGRAQHWAWTSPALAEEFKYVGDGAVSEGFACLFEYLVLDPLWLSEVMRFRDSDAFVKLSALHKLLHVRRAAAKLDVEAALHATHDVDQAVRSYAEQLTSATRFQYQPEEFLYDAEDGLHLTDGLRGWLLEAQLREYLKTRFGRRWWQRKPAAEFLIDLWNTGQRYSAEELARLADLGPLSMDALLIEFRQTLHD